jgi:hypothetical protein
MMNESWLVRLKLVEAILHGQVQDCLAARNLTGNIPVMWCEQRFL